MTDDGSSFRVAAIQAAPVFLDRDASVEKAVRLIRQAAGQGAMLCAFGEAWLPGYPLHALAAPASEAFLGLADEYLAQGVEIPGPEIEALCDAAREAHIDVVIGVSERDIATRGTLYSSLVFISDEGELMARHRKLRPAPYERAVWGDADYDICVHDRGYAIIGGLIGCEHQMALPTYALAEQGVQLHIAAWSGAAADLRKPSPWASQELLSRAFAVQTGSYVLCVGAPLSPATLPEWVRGFAGDAFTGGSLVIDPRGNVVAGPAAGETILYVDCLPASIRAAKIGFDCAGHSGRRDQLKLWTPMSDMQNQGIDGADEGAPGDGGYGAPPSGRARG